MHWVKILKQDLCKNFSIDEITHAETKYKLIQKIERQRERKSFG